MPEHADDAFSALRAEGLSEAAASSLLDYLELLERWSPRVNLTGARTEGERIELLVRPALRWWPLLRPGSLLDIGSGNGSPGLVLALVDPERPVTLLEPRTRRWAFLREAARRSGRPDVSVLRQRHEDYRGAPADNVTVRALRLSAKDLERVLAPGGQALLSAPVAGADPVEGVAVRAFRYTARGCST